MPEPLWRPLTASGCAGSGLAVQVGVSPAGKPVVVDLANEATPHLGVYGITGSGKSEAMRALVWALLRQNDPADLGVVLIDGKARELTGFAGSAHLIHPVVVAAVEFGPVLDALQREIDVRIADPARCVKQLVLVIDEVGDVLRATGGVTGAGCDALHRIASLGRGLGVHVVVGTHHPTADVMGRLVSASVKLRLCGAVSDDAASALIMGTSGAVGYQARGLAGYGDFLLVNGDDVRRLQGPLVTDEEMGRLPMSAEQTRLKLVEQPVGVHESQAPKPIAPAELAVVLAEAQRLGRAPGINRVEALVRDLDGECSTARAKRIRGSAERLVEELRQRGLEVVPT